MHAVRDRFDHPLEDVGALPLKVRVRLAEAGDGRVAVGGVEAEIGLYGFVEAGDERATLVPFGGKVVRDDGHIEATDRLVECCATVGVGAAVVGGGHHLRELGVVDAAQGMAAGRQRDGVVLVEVGIGKLGQLRRDTVLRLRHAAGTSLRGIDPPSLELDVGAAADGSGHHHAESDHVGHGHPLVEVVAEAGEGVAECRADVLPSRGFEPDRGIKTAIAFNVGRDEVVCQAGLSD